MRYFVLSFVIVIADQWSKGFMSDLLTLCRPGDCQSIVLLPVFNFTLLHNAGAAFSFLSDAGGWQRWLLVAVSTLVSAIIVVWLYRIKSLREAAGAGLSADSRRRHWQPDRSGAGGLRSGFYCRPLPALLLSGIQYCRLSHHDRRYGADT